MRNVIAAISVFMATTAFAPQTLQYVYISDDPKDTLYHASKSCSGEESEKKGNHKIMKVTLDDALNKYKRKPCPLCYKKEAKTQG